MASMVPDAGSKSVDHASTEGEWASVRRSPHPKLRPHVLGYHGYTERTDQPILRWEAPSTHVVLVISFGPAYRIGHTRTPNRWETHRSFLAGLDDGCALSESTGRADCVQIDLTPFGAHRLLGLPMSDLARRVVAFGDIWGRAAERLEDRLADAATWDRRFAILDQEFAARMHRAPAVSPKLLWAWERLRASGGNAVVGPLAAELGWSRKHLAGRFREAVGLPPKTVGRLMRFEQALARLGPSPDSSDATPDWADLALACGYYDQAHLIAEFRRFAGCTPTALLRRSEAETVPPAAVAAIPAIPGPSR